MDTVKSHLSQNVFMFPFLVNFQVSLCCSSITAYIAREFNSEMLRFPVIIKTTGRVRGIITLVTFVCFHRPNSVFAFLVICKKRLGCTRNIALITRVHYIIVFRFFLIDVLAFLFMFSFPASRYWIINWNSLNLCIKETLDYSNANN